MCIFRLGAIIFQLQATEADISPNANCSGSKKKLFSEKLNIRDWNLFSDSACLQIAKIWQWEFVAPFAFHLIIGVFPPL